MASEFELTLFGAHHSNVKKNIFFNSFVPKVGRHEWTARNAVSQKESLQLVFFLLSAGFRRRAKPNYLIAEDVE